MTAKDRCMVMSLTEAKAVLDALEGRPLDFRQIAALSALKIRVRDCIGREAKTAIMREIQPDFGKVEGKEFWEVRLADFATM